MQTALYHWNKSLLATLLILLLSMSLLFTGCSTTNNTTIGTETAAKLSNRLPADGRVKIVTTVFAAYDFARQIVGDKADVSLLLAPGTEAHSFEPAPVDIITISKCDLFIYVGGESDTWINDILESLTTSDLQVIRLMDCVDVVAEETVEGMQEERESAATATEQATMIGFDEHVWTSPKNAALITAALSAKLCELEPNNATVYESNTQAYLQQLNDLDAQFREVVASAKRITLIFGDRFPFRYFADEYGLKYYAAFSGCSSESEARPQTIAFLIDKVRSEHVPAVLKTELTNQGIADTISEECGVKVLTLHSVHNVSKDEMDRGATYLSLMKDNVAVLKEVLN